MIFNEQLQNLMMVDEILIYLRKSRADKEYETVQEVLSKHEDSIQEYAVRIFGKRIPEGNIFREVVSGETIETRPEMMKVLSAISSEKIKAVMVYDVQRLSRGDWEDGGKILTAFKYSNTLVITPSKIFDLNEESGYDYKTFKMELSAGYDYLEYIKATLHKGIVRSMKKGNYLGSVPPYGYRKVLVDKEPTLEIDENETGGVKMMFELYDSGIGIYSITNMLNDSPYKPRQGQIWKEATIRRILQSPVYIGKIRWNYRKEKKVYEDGKVKKIRPLGTEEELIIIDGKHPAIIDEELFYRVQEKFGSHTKEKPNTELRNMFASILRCASCGSSIHLVTYKTNRKPRIKCSNRNNRSCKTVSTNYELIVERVISTLEMYIKDFEIKSKSQDNNMVEIHQKMIIDLEKELAKLNTKEEELYDYLEDGIYSKETFLKRKAKNDAKIEEVKNKIKKATSNAPKQIDYEEKITKFKHVIEAIKDDNVKPKDKNILLKEIIEKIVYDRKETNDKGIDPSNFILEIFFKE